MVIVFVRFASETVMQTIKHTSLRNLSKVLGQVFVIVGMKVHRA